MQLSMALPYAADIKKAADDVVELEKAGLDVVWVAEAYSFDAISQLGYLAARTSRVKLGSAIVNVFSRSPALVGMTFAALDNLSQGRVICGLGASGPQVVEGFHGVPFSKPKARVEDYIQICRKIWRRELLVHDGAAVTVPLPPEQGTGLGKALKMINHPVRGEIPIWWAALRDSSVTAAARSADGWLPQIFFPERSQAVWGTALARGLADREPGLPPLQIAVGGLLAIGEHLNGPVRDRLLDPAREFLALYVGGMGARTENYYNEVACRAGYEAAARQIQHLYLSGRKDEAAAAVPQEWLDTMNFVGPPGLVRERIAAYKEAGVTTLSVQPVGPAPLREIERIRNIVDSS